MKKITLCAIALMASATSFAQTVLWDGENRVLGTGDTGFWDRCNPEVVDNPAKDAVNGSDKCLKFTITDAGWEHGDVVISNGEGYQFGSKRLSLKIKKADNSNVKVELTYKNGNSNAFKKVAAWYDGAGEWRTLYFDFSTNGEFSNPTEIAIFPTTDNFEGSKEVYIDDIRIEELPKVGDTFLKDLADGSLFGNIKLSGSWLKGECHNVDGDWQQVDYNDFATLNSKLSTNVTSVDMRGAVTKNVDVAQFFDNKNPNTIVYANEAYNHANVVAKQKFTNANNEEVTDLYAKNGLVLADVDANANAYAFSCPYAFTAANVKLTRTVREGINSFVLPFYVGASDLGAEALATFNKNKEADGKSVFFTKFDHADANVPFITVGLKDAAENKEFTFFGNQKLVKATPASFDGAFKGVYAPQSAENLYGIDANGKLHKGGASATINAFHAYYQPVDGAEAPANISFEGEATGINAVTTTSTSANGAVYDLSGRRVAASLAAAKLAKGIYVVNGKKVAVK